MSTFIYNFKWLPKQGDIYRTYDNDTKMRANTYCAYAKQQGLL